MIEAARSAFVTMSMSRRSVRSTIMPAAIPKRTAAAQIARNARLRRMPRSAAARLAPVNAPRVDRRERPALGEPLHVLFEIAPADEHAAPAGRTAKTDVGAEPDDAPGVAAARMRLAQHHDIVQK